MNLEKRLQRYDKTIADLLIVGRKTLFKQAHPTECWTEALKYGKRTELRQVYTCCALLKHYHVSTIHHEKEVVDMWEHRQRRYV